MERNLEKENIELRARLNELEFREAHRKAIQKKYREKDPVAYKAKRREQARLRKEKAIEKAGDVAGAMVNW